MSDESPSSPSQTLASSYDALTREQIDQWVSARRIEDLYLDFSTSPKCFEARGERENLAKSISAFANAAGGLIVWGVRATKDADDVDAAQEVEPIRDRVKFLANLTGYSGSAVSPPVPGLRSRMIDDSVAVTLVPESDGGPYMANLGLGRYYTRSGSTSLPMEHFQVVDVFNRRRRPDPRICATRLETADVVAIEIENVGRVTAKAPYVELRALGDWDLVEHANLTPIAIARRRGKPYGFGGNTAVVHPQTRLFVCQFGWQGHPPPDVFKLEYALAAEDAPLTTGLLTLRNQPGATQRSMSTWD